MTDQSPSRPPDPNLELRVQAEAEARGMTVEATRELLASEALAATSEQRRRARIAKEVSIDILLVTATRHEHRQLKAAALSLGVPFRKYGEGELTYYQMGVIGANRVASIQVETGPFRWSGSASSCLRARAETGAALIVLLGSAFGASPQFQQRGDVLVSDSVFLYDRKNIAHKDSSSAGLLARVARWICSRLGSDDVTYRVAYPPDARVLAHSGWVQLFVRAHELLRRSDAGLRVTFGTILSGGSRIESQQYRDELLSAIPATGFSQAVGGEMEAAGVVSASRNTNDAWLVVKGVSDFADSSERHADAARRAADFILRAIKALPVVREANRP
jgi:nucleoside phosphorylase